MMRLKKIKGKRWSKNGTTDSMLGQKSSPALAGPAAPMTTANPPRVCCMLAEH